MSELHLERDRQRRRDIHAEIVAFRRLTRQVLAHAQKRAAHAHRANLVNAIKKTHNNIT